MENRYQLTYKLRFYEYWHCGSGLSSGADVDLLVIKDKDGLPFIPGKTIKGLLREAVLDISNLSNSNNKQQLKKALGFFNNKKEENRADKGDCFFTNAEIHQDLKDAIVANQYTDYLFDTVSSTAILETGVAKDKSLRRMQVVIPCTLEGTILNIPDEATASDFEKGLKFIKRLGQNRNRGLGKCSFVEIAISPVREQETDESQEEQDVAGLSTSLIFKCRLKTDVVLNQRAATQGNQQSLDFIPGSNFLGIAASMLYKEENEENRLIFHSGKIRFGDAHPAKGQERSLHVPAAMQYPKLGGNEDHDIYIHHEVDNRKDADYIEFQAKQCRDGFYVFDDENKKYRTVAVEKTFAIKSAYDDLARRSRDKAMFGYESLCSHSEWIFEVFFEADADIQTETIRKVKSALTGERRIGRSRTAQYGLVEIEFLHEIKYEHETVRPLIKNGKPVVLVYADSRLIFEDAYGLPAMQPEAKNFGFPSGEIDWELSQVRTFQYAPWNFKRQARDADRCGIEKGSVFYITLPDNNAVANVNVFVGCYQNEGFGKVIFNPRFLDVQPDSNGKSLYCFDKKRQDDDDVDKRKQVANPEQVQADSLFKILSAKAKQTKRERTVYKLVNDFVGNAQKSKQFSGENFASQWGHIRQLAMQNDNKNDLESELFTRKDASGKPDAYLTHGVAKDKWEERGRYNTFKKFFDALDADMAQMAIINVAAEMAKITGRK